jgi:translocation and assembly module TamB
MNLRKITLLLTAPTLIVVAGLTAWSWLLHSEPGARWLLTRLDSSIPGSVSVSKISGDLGSGLQLDGLQFEDGNTRVDIEQLKITLNIDLLPPAASIESLQADSVAIQVLQASSQATDWDSTVSGLSLPLPVKFNDIRVSGLEYTGLSGQPAMVIQSIKAGGSLHRRLLLDQLSLALPDIGLDLSGELGLASPYPLSLEFQASGEVALQGKLDGSLESAVIELDSANPTLRVTGTLERLLQTPGWDLEISSPLVQWPLDDPEPDIRLAGMEAHSNGEWPSFELDLAGTLEVQGLEPSALKLSGEGTDNAFTARHLTLAGPELSLDATGEFSWKDELQLKLNASLERLEPGKWLDDWPENHPVNGKLSAEWGGEKLIVSAFSLAVANTAVSAEGHGVIDLQSGIVDAQVGWSDFSWPPGSMTPLVNSRSGNFGVSGQTEDWKLDGNLVLQAGELPEGQLRMSGSGNMESLDVAIHEGSVLDGSLSGELSWNWTGSQPFQAALAISGIDFTPLAPQYPGVVDANLTASGELEPFRLGVELQQLDGTIRNHPISADGGFQIAQNHFSADGLQLRSGASTLTLNGSIYDPAGIDFSANFESLGEFSEQLSGNLAAAGKLSLNPGSPRFSATLSGQQLLFGPLEIAQIETRERSGTGIDAGTEVLLTGLVIGPRPVDSLSFNFGGDQPLQRIGINAVVEGTNINLELNGSVNDWADPLVSGWSGSLSELGFNHQDQFILSLDQAVSLELNRSRFAMEQACFSGTRDARLCLASSWRDPDEFNISAELAAIPVGLLELLVDTDVSFTQILSGALNWSQTVGGARSGSARIEMSAGAIRDIDDDEVLLETGPGLFGFELAAGQLRQGELDLNFPGSGDIDFNFSIPVLGLGAESPIEGTARIDLSDIGAIGEIVPLFDTIDGVLDVDLDLSGTLSDPAFKGTAALRNGRLENLASGFSFSGINISGAVSEFDRSELRGSFSAGEGSGEISATIDFENILAPVINLALEGESLTLIDVPDLNVVVDPDITLNWSNKTLQIDGRLYVPVARLSPSHLPQSSVGQSEDIVIVAGELPQREANFLQDEAIRIRGSLEVELGEEIVIDLDVAEARVSGTTRFLWQDELIPIADGSFEVNGEIQAYGQFLTVTRGRIGFPGIPADNPHLNIRAEREIFGNSQIRRAGLMVAGTLRRPVIEAYTVPMTNKHRAQTLLVTGSDFNFEQGVGAVDVGMYVLPRLYISYGIGIFEDENVLSARFDIGRGFGIKATSGQRETGLDVSYTVER